MDIKVILILSMTFYFNQSFSQENDWFSYIDSTTNLVGYKDINDVVKIEPKFISIFGINSKFKKIIPVMEKIDLKNLNNYSTSNYYLLKNGKKVGIDSIYIDADMTIDCENEGRIRFRDKKTDKVGFFNSQGKVIIPAIYDEAYKFTNGLALVLKNGKKKCYEEKEIENCEHWYWEGETMLISDDNQVIIDNVKINDFSDIDWYSLQINNPGSEDEYKNFIVSKKDIYSFKILSKEFENWIYCVLSNAVKKVNLINYLNDEIVVGKNVNWESDKKKVKRFDKYAWFIDSRENMMQKNEIKIRQAISNIFNNKYKVSIKRGDQPLFIDELEYNDYNTDCGYNSQLFPYFVIYIKSDVRKIVNYLGFLRTKFGYKLIEIN